MQVEIDTTITYEFKSGNRKFAIDAWEFEDFVRSLWKDKATDTDQPLVRKDGMPVLKEDGTPQMKVELKWAIINAEVAAWIKEKTKVEVRPHEVEFIFNDWDDRYDDQGERNFIGTFSKKKAMLRGPQEPTPSSPPSTDSRYTD
jgi:hypothetical protein